MLTRKKRVVSLNNEDRPIPIVTFKNSLHAWHDNQKSRHISPIPNPGKASTQIVLA